MKTFTNAVRRHASLTAGSPATSGARRVTLILAIPLIAIVNSLPAAAQFSQSAIVTALRKQFEKDPKVKQLLSRDADVKRRFDKWLTSMAKEQLDVLKGESPNDPQLRKELLKRMKQDQDVRKAKPASEWENVDSANRSWLKRVLKKHGWPGKTLVGTDGAHAAWILVQHADRDRELQKKCLKLMQRTRKGEAAPRDVAFLKDRLLQAAGKPQLYGTQLKEVNGQLELQTVKDQVNLNRRREKVAMMPIEVYLLFANRNKTLRRILKQKATKPRR